MTHLLAGTIDPFAEPELTGLGRLGARGSFLSYPSGADAAGRTGARVLEVADGWCFRYFEDLDDVPEDWREEDLAAWSPIVVPGSWTTQGHGRPQYLNTRLPFPPDPPRVSGPRPTGLYRCALDVPDSWQGERLLLELGGVEQAGLVWLNGAFVGLTKDSRLPSLFDVTATVRPFGNEVAVLVAQRTDASYLEDQDQWRLGGIHRAVRLHASPSGPHLDDVWVDGAYDHATGGGRLRVGARADGLDREGFRIRAELLGAGVVLEGPLPHDVQDKSAEVRHEVEVVAELPSAAPWSAEDPVLATVVVVLVDPAGRELEATRLRVGFRSVAVADRELLVNGRPVLIRGVNRHEHSDGLGRTVTAEEMIEEIRVLKGANFNAVRTAHAPPDPRFLELCDEHGLYVIDEADVEAHALYSTIARHPRFQAAMLERAARTVLRDRSHPSVIAWSLGNESGYGPAHDAMAAWIRHADPTRPVHYEGAISRATSDWDRGHRATDIVCPMYPAIAELVAWAETTTDERPLIMCEYGHAMGNSCGGVADYWAAIRGHHGLQGGFLWELLDHGLRLVAPTGEPYWGYGGDFGDEPNDGAFCCDGLLWPDRRPHPAIAECAKVFQPMEIRPVAPERGRILVVNGYDFLSTDHLDGRWTLLVDGAERAGGSVRLPSLDPGDEAVVELDVPAYNLEPGEEASLVVRFHDLRPGRLLPVGHVVAWEQLPLPSGSTARAAGPRKRRGGESIEIDHADDGPCLRSSRFHLRMDGSSGGIRSLAVEGRELLVGGPEVTIWRAPIDNDRVRAIDDDPGDAGVPVERWRRAGVHRSRSALDDLAVEQVAGDVIRIVTRSRLVTGGGAEIVERRTLLVAGDGSLHVTHRFDIPPALVDLPRLGVRLLVPRALGDLEWFGDGPHETYRDRRASGLLARHRAVVSERYVPYIRPQEHGNVTGLRWLALRGPGGDGLLASLDGIGEGKASLYPDADLEAARHTCDLEPAPLVHLHLDVAQRGLGTGSCGPQTLPCYRIAAGRHELAYGLLPLGDGADPATEHRRSRSDR